MSSDAAATAPQPPRVRQPVFADLDALASLPDQHPCWC
jgi:hypothetical protein